ncbi:MAG: bacteriocin [Firmicutes bacterium]|nr:bacteriocin [Candidatus Colimorpha enterica]
MNFTKEQIEKAKEAKSAEELFALAKENGIEMTAEEAAKHYTKLSEDELNNVSGGCGNDNPQQQTISLLNLHIIPVGTRIDSVRSLKDPCPVCGAQLKSNCTSGYACTADERFQLKEIPAGLGHTKYYIVQSNDISQ